MKRRRKLLLAWGIQMSMSQPLYRIVVVGATSLLGREIVEELAGSTLSTATTVLLDNEQESGKLEEIAGEVAVLQAVEAGSFEGADVAIFTTRTDAEQYLETARGMGAAVVDATGTLQGAPVRAPQLESSAAAFGNGGLDLETNAVTAAHPVTVMLAAVLQRAGRLAPVQTCFATVLQPASENGAASLDEMHRQTVSLLSFQPVPREQFDAQAAFNLLSRFGEDAKAEIRRGRTAVETQLRSVLGYAVALPLTQWVQAPVFHGFAVSLFLQFEHEVDAAKLEEALDGNLIEIVAQDEESASNVSVAGQGRVQVEMGDPAGPAVRREFSLWMVADNLKLAAQTAVACAVELARLRPLGKVQ